MSEPDFGAFRKKLTEASEELLIAEGLAEQVDLHTSAAKRKIAEARIELDAVEERMKEAEK